MEALFGIGALIRMEVLIRKWELIRIEALTGMEALIGLGALIRMEALVRKWELIGMEALIGSATYKNDGEFLEWRRLLE